MINSVGMLVASSFDDWRCSLHALATMRPASAESRRSIATGGGADGGGTPS
eukprot:COSAG02_NODE_36979_length_448_cov_0.696275_1_plen_50_part_01